MTVQWLPLPSHHHLDCKRTIVHSYKGGWKVGEQIALHHELESAPEGWVPKVGYLEYLLLNDHTTEPIGIDVGEDWEYTADFDRELQFLYSRESRR